MEYYQTDALGSVRLVTTSSSTTSFASNYSPFGVNYGMTGFELLQYTEKPYDSLTGLYYYGARFYSPSIDRFITQDTYPGGLTDPLSLNRYIYARDNPMKYVDPTGHKLAWITGTDSVVGTDTTTAPTGGNLAFIIGTDTVIGAGTTSSFPPTDISTTPPSVSSSSSL